MKQYRYTLIFLFYIYLTLLRTAITLFNLTCKHNEVLFEFINIKHKGNSVQVAEKCRALDIYLCFEHLNQSFVE